MGRVDFGFLTCNGNCRPKIFENPVEGRPNDAAKPLIYKIFENPAEGRPHDAAKPRLYKIFDNPAEGRPNDAAKPLIYIKSLKIRPKSNVGRVKFGF